MLLELRQLRIQPGQQLLLEDISWQQLEGILAELWRYGKQGLQINVLQAGEYVESSSSSTFPDIPIIELVNKYVQQSQVSGRTQAILAFRNCVPDIWHYTLEG